MTNIISWNTKKVENGFSFRIYKIISSNTPNADGSYAKFVTIKTGIKATRDQAKGAAQRIIRVLKTRK